MRAATPPPPARPPATVGAFGPGGDGGASPPTPLPPHFQHPAPTPGRAARPCCCALWCAIWLGARPFTSLAARASATGSIQREQRPATMSSVAVPTPARPGKGQSRLSLDVHREHMTCCGCFTDSPVVVRIVGWDGGMESPRWQRSDVSTGPRRRAWHHPKWVCCAAGTWSFPMPSVWDIVALIHFLRPCRRFSPGYSLIVTSLPA